MHRVARLKPPGRHVHGWLVQRRPHLVGRATLVAALAVVGPGILAGLSDDDPAGITTYSILGADYGYRLLWVLALSTAALIVFHELGARLGVVTGKGLLALVRERYGKTAAAAALAALIVANLGTLSAEFAGVAAGVELLGGPGRNLSVPIAAVGVCALVLAGSNRDQGGRRRRERSSRWRETSRPSCSGSGSLVPRSWRRRWSRCRRRTRSPRPS
ncbi:MAG: divalent metal cation transporter, partial [Thermoleophilaceae bacterium]